MPVVEQRSPGIRKLQGVHYTPEALARFVARKIVAHAALTVGQPVKALDPACGDGELLIALARELLPLGHTLEVVGRDIDAAAVAEAQVRFDSEFPDTRFRGEVSDFLALKAPPQNESNTLFMFAEGQQIELFDLIIANPPYVRTQHLGADRAQEIGRQFGLSGRVDLYQAFLAQFNNVLAENGSFGVIVPNRFLTTKGGEATRRLLLQNFSIDEIVDLGDTKLFEAAVLPALIFAKNTSARSDLFPISSVYSTSERAQETPEVEDILQPLEAGITGQVVAGSETWQIHRGELSLADLKNATKPWVQRSEDSDFLQTVEAATWSTFGALGKIRVGVKTTADKVFIRKDWSKLPSEERPELELMFPLVNAKTATRWNCRHSDLSILYPYDMRESKRTPLDIESYPKTRRYLESHRESLEGRKYVIEGGRHWWEIWVPQKPAEWSRLKIVFPDISIEGRFALDRTGALVNGNCYWIPLNDQQEDLGYLAVAVANSSLAMKYYDARFGNKLYGGRRRFISQYVENFPLPDPEHAASQRAIELARQLEHEEGDIHSLEVELDSSIWSAFGVEKA